MKTLLEIYFGINIFISGFFFARNNDNSNLLRIFNVLFYCLFGITYGVLIFIWVVICNLGDEINAYTQFKTFLAYHLTNRYKNVSEDVLRLNNTMKLRRFSTNSVPHKKWRKWNDKINKLNNYKP